MQILRRFRVPTSAIFIAWIGATSAVSPVSAHADSIKIGGTGTGLGTMKLMAQEFKRSRPDANLIVMPSLGSTGAIRAAVAGDIAIGISLRPVTPEESSQGASSRPYAKTPFVVVTGARNDIAGFTLSQLAQIYSGKVTSWPDGSLIRLVLRPAADSDTILLRRFSAEMNAAITAALARKGFRIADTDQDNADALEQLSGSLGTATLTQILSENRAAKLRLLAVDGVNPGLQSLAMGRYPYFKILYLVTGRNLPPLATAFIAFIRSSAGQAILAGNGNLVVTE